MSKVTLIDNYDSFTWNLVHYLGALGAEVEVVRNDARSAAEILAARPDAIAERARRADVLQRAENEFDPIPFETESARVFGRISAAVLAFGRTPRRRIADLMIASTAAAAGLPLYTTNPSDFDGLDDLVRVVPVRRPR